MSDGYYYTSKKSDDICPDVCGQVIFPNNLIQFIRNYHQKESERLFYSLFFISLVPRSYCSVGFLQNKDVCFYYAIHNLTWIKNLLSVEMLKLFYSLFFISFGLYLVLFFWKILPRSDFYVGFCGIKYMCFCFAVDNLAWIKNLPSEGKLKHFTVYFLSHLGFNIHTFFCQDQISLLDYVE